MLTTIAADFQRRFDRPPLLVRAPGRINLIGEHTDYNGGFVLPAAVDKEIYFAVALNGTHTARLVSYDKQEMTTADLDDLHPGEPQWANYLKGVAAQFGKRGLAVPGFDCVFGGTVPIGAGMSSSAALECGLAAALDHLLETHLDRLELALIGQAAEHEYAGVKSGLMDQFASFFGKAGHVVRLDCRSLDHEYFPFDTNAAAIVLCDTGVKHALAATEYNTRRQECERGVKILQRHQPQIESLRDATLEHLEHCRPEMGNTIYHRCRYVVAENRRVLTACRHLVEGNLTAVGQDMYASHAGLRDEYEVSCPELDALVEIARTVPGVFGARMMGGGFGGCTINLVAPEHVAEFIRRMTEGYQREMGLPLETYQTAIADGVSVETTG